MSAAIKELRHVTSPRAVAKSTLAAVIRACVSAAPAQSVHVIHSLDKQLKNPREVRMALLQLSVIVNADKCLSSLYDTKVAYCCVASVTSVLGD